MKKQEKQKESTEKTQKQEKKAKKKSVVNEQISAFSADLQLAEYEYRVKTGQLTEKEKKDRERVLKFLGYGE